MSEELEQTGQTEPTGRYMAVHTCWCHPDAKTDCRFHPRTELGWEECPNDPKFDKQRAPGEVILRADKPRTLFAKRPPPKKEAA